MKRSFLPVFFLFSFFFLFFSFSPFNVSAATLTSSDSLVVAYPAGTFENIPGYNGYASIVSLDSDSFESLCWDVDGIYYVNIVVDSQIYTLAEHDSLVTVGDDLYAIDFHNMQAAVFSLESFGPSYFLLTGRNFDESSLAYIDVTFNYDESFNKYVGDVSSTYDLFYDLWFDRTSLYISLPQLGVSFDTFPELYYSYIDVDGSAYYFTGRGDVPSLGLADIIGHRVLAADLGARPMDSLTASFSFPVSAIAPADPAGDSSLLSDLSDTAGAFLSTVGQIVDSIVSSPLLLVTVGIFFLGGCVALLGRFLGKD